MDREIFWSGRPDLNRGPPAPKAGALPGCATPRHEVRKDYKGLPNKLLLHLDNFVCNCAKTLANRVSGTWITNRKCEARNLSWSKNRFPNGPKRVPFQNSARRNRSSLRERVWEKIPIEVSVKRKRRPSRTSDKAGKYSRPVFVPICAQICWSFGARHLFGDWISSLG